MAEEFSHPVVQDTAPPFQTSSLLRCMLLAFTDTVESPELFISTHNGNWVKTGN